MHASALFAGAVARLLCRVDEALDKPAALDFVDLAAGRGELVTGMLAALPPEVAARVRAYAVEIADRPVGLDPRVEWLTEPPEGDHRAAVRQRVAGQRPRGGGRGRPRRRTAARAREGGRHRAARGTPLRRGGRVARPVVAPDARGGAASRDRPPQGHGLGVRRRHRRPGAGDRRRLRAHPGHPPPFGTLTGFREGRETVPVPDGSCDITAHVALDACAEAGATAANAADPLPGARLLTQRAGLRALGVTGVRPRSRWPPPTPWPTSGRSRAPVKPPNSPHRAASATSAGSCSRLEFRTRCRSRNAPCWQPISATCRCPRPRRTTTPGSPPCPPPASPAAAPRAPGCCCTTPNAASGGTGSSRPC